MNYRQMTVYHSWKNCPTIPSGNSSKPSIRRKEKVTLELLGYPENSVGRLMNPDYVYVYEYNTVEQVLQTIRRFGTNTETIDVIYVINERANYWMIYVSAISSWPHRRSRCRN